MSHSWENKELRIFIMAQARQSFKYWPILKELAAKYRITRGLYKCACCGESFKSKEVHKDHVEPVIDPNTGFVDWNTFFDRLYPDLEGLQYLCVPCHKQKSAKEAGVRSAVRKARPTMRKRRIK